MMFQDGDRINVVLTGATVERTRQDSDGLKLCLRGKGFFIWVNADETDVQISWDKPINPVTTAV